MPGHPKSKQKKKNLKEKHAGGPLKRQGYLAEEWNVAIGPSLDALPGTQLPLVRTILQRHIMTDSVLQF